MKRKSLPVSEYERQGVHAETGARMITKSFDFPDGSKGGLIVLRLKNEVWVPHKTIKSIAITFYDEEDTTLGKQDSD